MISSIPTAQTSTARTREGSCAVSRQNHPRTGSTAGAASQPTETVSLPPEVGKRHPGLQEVLGEIHVRQLDTSARAERRKHFVLHTTANAASSPGCLEMSRHSLAPAGANHRLPHASFPCCEGKPLLVRFTPRNFYLVLSFPLQLQSYICYTLYSIT